MDFKDLCDSARKWADGESDFNVESLDEEERKLNFRIIDTDFVFTITVPSDDSGDWMVWSESEQFLPYLQDIQEYLSSNRKRTMTEILNKVKAECHKLLPSSAEEENESDDDDDDDDDDFDDYYNENEEVQEEETEVKSQGGNEDDEEEDEDANFFGSGSSPVAVQRLLKDLKAFRKDGRKFGLDGGPRNDNLFVWDIKLVDIPDSKLAKDLDVFSKKHNTEPCINLEMMFPADYPMSPPFVRVTTPRFKFLTGHVTIGGSICMEMLTKSGWTPTNDIENILVQIRCEILSDPNAQLDLNNANTAYTMSEAKSAFTRMVQRYGWDKS
ncbi:ubiquitin-conjugating enzyme E2 Q2-like [Saccostrea echinata]|uniref:ubiquitin-conjugating enzyme E2 Q2-like n=1 Tax=Saccostrea echinata TaxID=191078 RepID=UPI002A832B2B|nr:ubiquitin-conjugating enzyme E2 Q2-like [Saccostrea echinata]